MDCTTIRESLSARLDGEAPVVEAAVVDDHLVSCASCATWAVRTEGLHRMVRVGTAEVVPDLSARIVDATLPPSPRTEDPRSRWAEPVHPARWALLTVALTQLVLAAPALLGDDPGATVHVARELGAFDVALAVGLVVAAWQPARAWGLLPVALALAVVMGGTATVDLLQGQTSGLDEARHLLDLAGVGLLWLVARDGHHPAAGAARGAI